MRAATTERHRPMLQAIVRWSIHNRAVIVALAAILLAAGFYAAAHSKLDVFPEFAPPLVTVQTEAPGLSALEVEQLVTLPMERTLGGLPGLDLIRSQSIQGLSALTVIFQDDVDIYRARQLVSERFPEVIELLPDGAKTPRMGPMTKTSGRLVVVGFTSETLSPLALRDIVQWTVRPRLLALRGVALVTLFGGEVRQFQVQIHPDQLIAHNLTLSDVLSAARQATGVRGAGFQENLEQRVVMRVEAQIDSAEKLGETFVTATGAAPVRLRDVATVVEGPEPKFGDALINGRPGVALLAYKQLNGDTVEITERIEAEMEKMRPALEHQGIKYHPALFRQANFIQQAIKNVVHSLLIGAALVAVVLFLLLFNLRTALISLTAIPLSLLGAILVLWAWGVSLNTLTLGGLAIAVGEVVDDAIIDVENIFRRLRENARLGHPRSAAEVVLSASLEVRGAVVYASFIVVLVFVPVFLMSGLQGRLFSPLGYAYALAVLASLAVALTVTPALGLLLLPHAGGAEEPPLLRWLQGGYERVVRRLDGELPVVAAVMLLLAGGAGWALYQCGGDFLPELRESHYIIHTGGIPGTSLAQNVRMGKVVTEELRKIPAVLEVSQLSGRAELGEDTWGVEYSELEVPLRPLAAEDADQVERSIKQVLRDRFPGFYFSVFSFLSECIHDTLAGTIAPVAVKIYGDDLGDIDQAARQIAQAVAAVPGSDNTRPEPQVGQPEMVIRVRPEDAARFGLRNTEILDAVGAAYQGAVVAHAYDRNRIVNVVVVLDPKSRNDVATVADLRLDASAGWLRLKQVADVYLSDGRFLIAHEGGLRRQQVTCNVQGRDVESFVAEAERRVAEIDLPPGVSYAFTGEHLAKQAAQHELLLLSLASGAGVFLLLWMAFGSVRRLGMVLMNLPFALIGGVAAIYMTTGVLDIGALVGFVTLFGITMRNGIMMVSHWQHLHEVEGLDWGAELIFRGARERLAPVLMTALVTGLGLLPIAWGSGEAGREIEGPMALVILGGLVTSTALNLFVLPVFYRHFGVGALAATEEAEFAPL